MNALLENLLIIFLKITLLSWLIWGIVGSIIIVVIICIFLNKRYDLDKFIISALPILIIPYCIKTILSNEELIAHMPSLKAFRNINETVFIIMGIFLALWTYNFIKEL